MAVLANILTGAFSRNRTSVPDFMYVDQETAALERVKRFFAFGDKIKVNG